MSVPGEIYERPESRNPQFEAWEAVALHILAIMIVMLMLVLMIDFDERARAFGDNESYISLAEALKQGSTDQINPRHFWGTSLATAALSVLLHLSELRALLVLSILSSVVAVYIAARIWGAHVAILFTAINSDWLQRSTLGGAEPLFVMLIFGSLLFYMRSRTAGASVLAGLSVWVRATGSILLASQGLVLLSQKKWKHGAVLFAVSIPILLAYSVLLTIHGEGAFSNVAWYQKMGLGLHSSYVPFVSITGSMFDGTSTWTNWIQIFCWEVFAWFSLALLFFRRRLSSPIDRAFACLFLLSFLALPAWWLKDEFVRYLTPAVPILLLPLARFIPDRRAVHLGLVTVGSLFAAASAIGIRNLF